MNKIANVIFAYSPNNDDELELTVGDKIEVIGFEEEGWLKGRLRGRVGVFPENFVQLLESADTTPTSTLNQNNTNKLNSIFGSRVSSKNSISSNSLNSNNNNNNNNNNGGSNNNIKNSVSNNNLIMNNTHQLNHEGDAASNEYPYSSESMHSTSSLGERRPKPLKGIGYGDIFAAAAKTKPLPADPPVARPTPFAKASDRPSATNSLASTLQKSIPKKPPPPAPVDNGSTNGSGHDQAPALPPKPITQFNPLLNQRTNTAHKTQLARVIYAYKPDNDDELELEVGDIINVLDMKIEDAGWWRGELRGRVGVFPDNFVELIKPLPSNNQETIGQSNISGSQSITNNSIFQQAQQQQQPLPPPISTEAKPVMKSVFAGTPKGFSKELESNLEKHNNPAAFLSLKRNKLQQMTSTSVGGVVGAETNHSLDTEAALASPISHPSMNNSDSSDRQNGHGVSSSESSPGKLNHITANRAKGPSRRPPSNILNKRNQINELSNNSNTRKQEFLNESKEELPPASLPVFNQVAQSQSQLTDHGFLASLPSEQSTHQKNTSPSITTAATATSVSSPFTTHTQSAHESASPMSTKTSSSNSNSSPSNNSHHASNDITNSPSTPKFNQRNTTNSTLGVVQPESKSRLSSESSPSTPPWMVELRKTNAEKKRDPLPASTTSSLVESIISNSCQPVPSQTPTTITSSNSTVTGSSASATVAAATVLSTPAAPPAQATTVAAIPSAPVATPNVASTTTQTSTSMMNENVLQQTKHDHNNIINSHSKHQISRDVTNEIDELRNEVRQLREEFKGMNVLKEALDTVKVELKACQSATENQRRYIKELVNNLADERKKIAEMQVEIDRNLR